MPDFRRGAQAVADAQARAKASSGNFTPFTPSIWWTDPAKNEDDASRYIMFLNPMADIPQVDLIGYIPQVRKKGNGDKFTTFESVIARTDVAIGENDDPMTDEWGAEPRETHIAVAVELEPTFESFKGRQRAVGFEVKTQTFTRRIRDDEGELTDEEEDVTAPVVGFVAQSPHNFFNLITSFDNNTAPIEETAIKIERLDKNTYSVEGYPDQEVDLSALVEFIDGLSYLGDGDDATDLIAAADEADSDQEAALLIGAFLLDKRLDELCDRERYDKLFEGIDKPFKFGSKSEAKPKAKKERPARRGQRRSAQAEEPEASEPEETPEADESEPEEKPKPKRATRTRKAAASKAEAADEPKKTTAKQRDPASLSKLDELRERQAKRKATAAA